MGAFCMVDGVAYLLYDYWYVALPGVLFWELIETNYYHESFHRLS